MTPINADRFCPSQERKRELATWECSHMANSDADNARQMAIERLKVKRGFSGHVTVYVLVNMLLILIWSVTGRGYFWPIWPISGWGIGLAMHAWNAFFAKPITEEDIRQEIERGR